MYILSMCIPTYNRGNILKQSLESYISSQGFDDDVEIVISDNASTDNTEEVVRYYTNRYPNIKYYKNEKNIRDANFPLALNRATGEYIKLINDNSLITEKGLSYLKEKIKENIKSRMTLFFTNDFIFTFPHKKEFYCKSFDDYIRYLSTFVTAISCFGCWREQWQEVEDREKCSDLMLCQDDWSYQILERYNICLLYNERYFVNMPKPQSSTYNWFKVHLDNYYKIMEPYINKGLISHKTVRHDKMNLLRHFMPELTNIYLNHHQTSFDSSGTSTYIWKHYKKLPMFYLFLIMFPFWGGYLRIKGIISRRISCKK